MILFDTHSHIYGPEFDHDRAEVFRRAHEAGVTRFILPDIDSEASEAIRRVCGERDDCYPLVGLHPTSVNDNPLWRDELARVENFLKNPPYDRYYGIGEVGLDFYWSTDFRREQTECFVRQVELALQYDLPLVIHTRAAWDEMLEILKGFRGRGLKGVLHAFDQETEVFRRIDAIGGFLVGIGGVVTYKNSRLAKAVEEIPLEKMVLETDSPYLPPVPFRGKRNESGFLCYICRKVAEIKGVAEEEVAALTTDNALKLFDIENDC